MCFQNLFLPHHDVPFVGAEARQDEQNETDEEVGGDDVQPDLDGERVEEGEEAGTLPSRPLEEDTDTEIHEWLREVNHLLPYVVDGQRRNGEVGVLQHGVVYSYVLGISTELMQNIFFNRIYKI